MDDNLFILHMYCQDITIVFFPLPSGLTVHAEKGNGVVVKSIIRGGVVQQDGRLAVGDYITAVNNSSIRNHSNQEARSLIRRCSLDRSDIRSVSDVNFVVVVVMKITVIMSCVISPKYRCISSSLSLFIVFTCLF